MKVQQENEISEIKREKRRLDDLLTIRENEIYKIKESAVLSDKKDAII